MQKVVILGGGVAGLSAAHELVSRGFAVEVYERNPLYYGGKARSIEYNHDAKYQKPLPAEHGFRFFPGFYKHITATMQHIPYPEPDSQQSVYDNLTPTARIMVARYNMPPIVTLASFPKSLKDLKLIIHDLFGIDTGLSTEEKSFFAERVWQLITSCKQRFDNDYERLSWWQYTGAERFSQTYRHLLVEGLTRTLVAAKARQASTKTGGSIFLQLLYCITDPGVETDRVLDGPTNERWLYAWLKHLHQQGVRTEQGVSLTNINMDNGSVNKVVITDSSGQEREIQGDYYIMAMPVERAAPLINPAMVAADKRLTYIKDLAPNTEWMNGIQFYLNQDVELNKGHIICSDSEWALTCISQIQFWKNYAISQQGDGNVKGVLSIDISDWSSPSPVTGKAAKDCTLQEVVDEVWRQLKASLNTDKTRLTDDMLVDHFIDRDIRNRPSSQQTEAQLENIEPLLVNRVNTWSLRPDADCAIPNLFFASDYVRTDTDLATMEGANEAARRAVNCILDQSGNPASKCKVWKLHTPFCFKPLQWYDRKRFEQGLPWTARAPIWLEWLTGILGFSYLIMAWVKSKVLR